jgi:glycerol transport system ATP-binding protein
MTLELKGVTKRLGGETHIFPTDIRLEEDGFNILLGTTLAGKTTLMMLMAGLEKPSDGEVWFDGKNVTGVAVQKRNVAMVYQQFINYGNLTVFENIASPLRVARVKSDEIKRRVGNIAELLKLSPMLDRHPSELSGGQQQRTALARALVKNADLILLDEPLANLDFKLREELRDELPRMFENRRCTVVYATSEPTEALLLGGHTATLHEGHVSQFTRTSTGYRNPENLVSARVFSDPPINTAVVTKSGNRFSLSDTASWAAGEHHASLPDGPYTIGIRPHHIQPARLAGENRVCLQGRVLVTELSGSESVIHFEQQGQTWVSQSHGIHSLEVSSTAEFSFDPQYCLLFDGNERRVQ